MLTRRYVLASALAAPAILRFGTGTAHAATTLKISHQFPGGTVDKGDFRDRLTRKFADEVAKRSGGEIAAEIYPNSSLIKTNAQFSAMRKGALDISLVPLSYAGGEVPETNIGLMPGLVSTYDQGLRWKNEPVGKALTDFLADKGIIILTWIWQAGGVASRSRPVVAPEDAKGLKIRGGSREMDMVLQTAGASVLSLPSNELYAAMQTGACDAGLTSSTSLISFRLEEIAKALTSGAGASYWFMLEPLLMSKSIFDALPKNQQDIILAVGAGADRGLRRFEPQCAHPGLVSQRQLLAGRGGGLPSGRRHLHDGGLCAATARPRRYRGVCRAAVADGQPYQAMAGRCRQLAVLRILCLEIMDAGARSLGRRTGFEFDVVAAAGDPLCPDGVGHDAIVRADPAADHYSLERTGASMTVLGIGISYGIATLVAMFSGMPIAFALGAVAVVFMGIYMPAASLDTVTQNVYEEMASITLLSIPLFILKGAAIGKSRAGQDLYSALHAWLHRVPGGLGVANVFACALFAAMAGSSPATCSAIGSAGIPAAGGTLGILLPPSITMILFAVAAEKSLGRLFLAGIGPGLLLVSLFGVYAVIHFRKEYAAASALYTKTGATSAILARDKFTMAERFNVLPRVLPFVLLLTGVMIALYGGYATPSETAGLGGLLAMTMIAAIYSVWWPTDLGPIMKSTIRESSMLMMIIGMSLLYSYVMSYLHISQSAAESVVAMHLPRWGLLFAILVMVVVLGFFLPPVSIILMTAPIILPPLRAANFDIIWFGVVMTIVMEMGLIHPPVGLNIFVIRNVAPDIPLSEVIWGTLPFVLLMMLAVLLLCFMPQISTWLPDLVMGPDGGR